MTSVEDILEVELPLELEDETSDADGIVAIEKMRMARTKLFNSLNCFFTKLTNATAEAIWRLFLFFEVIKPKNNAEKR